MKHPSVAHPFAWAAREMSCFILGHRWKHCGQRRKDNYEELQAHPERIRYGERKRENPYWEPLGWWDYKCTRCRLKIIHQQPWLPWYRTAWTVLRMFCVSFVRHAKYPFEPMYYYRHAPRWKLALAWLPISFGQACYDAFSYWERAPMFLFDLFFTLTDRMEVWLGNGDE